MDVDHEVDASAIDSQVLAVMMRDDPSLAPSLRVLDSLGPSFYDGTRRMRDACDAAGLQEIR